jgi:tetratricopeptide (TPR) repeat protein
MSSVINRKAIFLLLFCLGQPACFKKYQLNENALLHHRACVESIELNDPNRAQIHCELCLEYDSSMPECLNGIGLIALMNKDEEKAKEFFAKALRQNNDFSQARNNLGVIYFSNGDFRTALKYFSRALEIDPSNTDARYNFGLSHFRLGQHVRAHGDKNNSIEHFLRAKDQMKKLLAIEPTYSGAFRDLGLIELNLYDLNEFEDKKAALLDSAKQAFSQCSLIDQENSGCYEGLAQVFFLEGRFDNSFANYFLCLSYEPNNSACRSNIALVYEKSAHLEGGYKSFMKLVTAQSSNALAHEAFCSALFERGLDQEAVEECEIALKTNPHLCHAQFLLASHFLSVLNQAQATKYCRDFLACKNTTSSNDVKKCQEILATMRR